MAWQLGNREKKQVVYTSESSSTELNYLNVKALRPFINEHGGETCLMLFLKTGGAKNWLEKKTNYM